MIVKLSSEQCSNQWEKIFDSVKEAVPQESVNVFEWKANLLAKVLSGVATVWLVAREDNVQLMLVAVEIEDAGTGGRSLLVYSVYGFGNIVRAEWSELFDALTKYARERKALSLSFYTKVPKVLELAKYFGADIETHFVKMGV